MKESKWLLVIPLVILIHLLSGCSPTKAIDSTSTPLISIASLEPTIQAVPTLTQDATALSEMEKPTPTPYNSAQKFLDWTAQVENCEPPCVWGISPGITTVDELYEEIGPFGEIVEFVRNDGTVSYTVFIEDRLFNNQPKYIEAGFYTANSIVEEISLWSKWLHPNFDTRISNFLTKWGKPNEIWVQVNLDTQLDKPDYDLQLLFEEVPAIVWLASVDLEITEAGYAICPQRIQGRFAAGPGVHFWDAGGVPKRDISINLAGYEPLISTNPQFDETTFWEIYKDPDATECILVSGPDSS